MNAEAAVPELDALSPEQQQRLAQVLERCLLELEQGRNPDVDEMAAEVPDLAEPLKNCLGSLQILHQAAAAFGTVSRPRLPHGMADGRLGDYEILREIGRGGMGVVYQARQISLERLVALKVLPLAGLLDRKQIARFQKEARAAAQLHHPNIVPVFAVGCERGVYYYAMQYVEGRPLDLAIRHLRQGDHGSLSARAPAPAVPEEQPEQAAVGLPETHPGESEGTSPPSTNGDPAGQSGRVTARAGSTVPSPKDRDHFRRVAELGIQAAEALEHAHQYGIIHRDVKPSNLLLDDQGAIWITDFGLARFQTDAQVTATGDVLGTLHYMSPEQASGRSALIDPRTDVYSLGVTLYELLTLEVPFEGQNRQQLLGQISNDEPRSPRRVNPAIPADLETIVLKSIAKAREHRYATAQELADDLRRFLEGRPTLARRPTLADRVSKWARRHQAAVWSGAVLMAVTMVGLGVATWLMHGERAKTAAALERSEAHYRQARRAVDRFATRHAEQLASLPGAERLRQELLGDTLEYYQEFIGQAIDDPTLRPELAATHFRAAGIAEQLGDRARARTAYEQSRQLFEQLAGQHPKEAKHRADLALCHNNLGLLASKEGKTEEAEQAYRRAIALQSELTETASDEAQRAAFRSDLALSYGNLALLQAQAGRASEAEGSYQAAIGALTRLTAEHPHETRYLARLATTYNNLSLLYAKSEPAKAEQFCRQGLQIQRQLVSGRPGVPACEADLALSYNNLGALAGAAGRPKESETSYQEAIAIQRRLVQRAPAVVEFRRDLAISHNNLGRLRSQSRDPARARESFREARAIAENLVRDCPSDLNYRSDLGGILNNLAMTAEQLGRPDEAIALYAEAISHQRLALERGPAVARFRQFLSQQYANYSRVLRAQRRGAEADAAAAARDGLGAGAPPPDPRPTENP